MKKNNNNTFVIQVCHHVVRKGTKFWTAYKSYVFQDQKCVTPAAKATKGHWKQRKQLQQNKQTTTKQKHSNPLPA